MPTLTVFTLELGIGTRYQKLEWWRYWTEKKFDDIFSHLDEIHQRVGQTDRRTYRRTGTGRQQRSRLRIDVQTNLVTMLRVEFIFCGCTSVGTKNKCLDIGSGLTFKLDHILKGMLSTVWRWMKMATQNLLSYDVSSFVNILRLSGFLNNESVFKHWEWSDTDLDFDPDHQITVVVYA